MPAQSFQTIPPTHVAIIMDGNRRWARARSMPAVFGHRQGGEAVRRAVKAAIRHGVRYLTLFAFSSENWRRPQAEVSELMNLLRYFIRRELDEIDKQGVRIQVIGERSRLDQDVRELIENAERKTAANARMILTVALNYGGRQELVEAARRLAASVQRGELAPEQIDEVSFSKALWTGDMPDPDLLIRTSGELRVSNFLLWQLAYSEFVFLPVAWPDFDEQHFAEALAEFARRDRRYGAASA